MPLQTPLFRAEHVGSLIRPAILDEAQRRFSAGLIGNEDLQEIEHEALQDAIRMQQDIGLRAITDGAFTHTTFTDDILLKLEGAVRPKPKAPTSTQPTTTHPTVELVDRLSRTSPLFVQSFKALSSMAKETPKAILPSPNQVRSLFDRSEVALGVYRDIDEVLEEMARLWREEIADLAENGCTYLQIDEYLPDGLGETQTLEWISLLNAATAGRPETLTITCRLAHNTKDGAASLDHKAEMLFNEIATDRFILDLANPGASGFELLRHAPKGKIAILGLIDAQSPDLEKRDDLKRSIDAAAKFVPMEQLALSPNTGFAGSKTDNSPTSDDQKRKLDLIVRTALDVWGTN